MAKFLIEANGHTFLITNLVYIQNQTIDSHMPTKKKHPFAVHGLYIKIDLQRVFFVYSFQSHYGSDKLYIASSSGVVHKSKSKDFSCLANSSSLAVGS